MKVAAADWGASAGGRHQVASRDGGILKPVRTDGLGCVASAGCSGNVKMAR